MRKKRSLLNMLASLGSHFIAMLFTFVTQACIVRILGIEYSGVNGLFTNIITMLSVAELGIGTTIIFKLYKPLANNNIEEIKSWMNFYKVCYKVIALLVTIVGLIIIPFVPIIVGNITIKENIIILYLISLLDTVLSYIMTYKRSLLYADQKNYIINIIHIGYIILMNTIQIILLLLLKNYITFLAIKIIFRLLENIIINIYVDKNYKYINEKSKNLNKSEKKDVFDRIKAIFLQKISFVINKGIDNIVLSYLLGIVSVGLYANYFTIVAAITQIIYQIVSSITASVGNLLTENNYEKSYDIYKKINMINSFFTGIALVVFSCSIQPFICLWVGEQYVLSNSVVLAFALYIYSDSIRRSITIYKDAAGICKEDRWMYVIMAAINLILSIVLCEVIGISGVILGTAISYLFLIIYSYPKYIFKPIFKKGVLAYYIENITYLLFIIISLSISFGLSKFIIFNNYIVQFLFNGIIAIFISSITFILMFYTTSEFKYYNNFLVMIFRKVKKG